MNHDQGSWGLRQNQRLLLISTQVPTPMVWLPVLIRVLLSGCRRLRICR